MPVENVLSDRLRLLRGIVRDGFEEAPAQVQGFVVRVRDSLSGHLDEPPLYTPMELGDCLAAVRFNGYPALALVGYSLGKSGSPLIDGSIADRFLQCVEQQSGRPPVRQSELAGDTLALLGITDGLRSVARSAQADTERLQHAQGWVRQLLEQHGGLDARQLRARLLASDLLDDQGRFGRHSAQSDDAGVAALDLCLCRTWVDVLRHVSHPKTTKRREIFKYLLTAPPPREGELFQAAVGLCALDMLVDEIAAATVLDTHQVTRILAATQGSFRRWRWEENATRQGVMPARWLIDKEADVQAFLLAVLYPYFVDQLEDEQYLQGYGLRQGRFDFAITSLGLIVEVKVIRSKSDVNKVDAEIADDLALYFKEGNPFKSMVVYIYDDSDKLEPEKYPPIRDALKRRSERIVDVVIVQRPSMIPNRDVRQQ